MEEKLTQYRARRAKQEKMIEFKAKFWRFFGSLLQKIPNSLPEPAPEPLLPADTPLPSEEDDDSLRFCSFVDILVYLLWFSLWVIGYVIFIKLQFGTVFLIVSGLVFIYFNTRTGPRRIDEVSAYSVFNKNCESIDGTLKAEQFEREIRYGPAVVN